MYVIKNLRAFFLAHLCNWTTKLAEMTPLPEGCPNLSDKLILLKSPDKLIDYFSRLVEDDNFWNRLPERIPVSQKEAAEALKNAETLNKLAAVAKLKPFADPLEELEISTLTYQREGLPRDEGVRSAMRKLLEATQK